jgi:hypothetical protein
MSDNHDDLISALAGIAPIAATLLAGPAAGTVVSAITQALGVPSGTPSTGLAQIVGLASSDDVAARLAPVETVLAGIAAPVASLAVGSPMPAPSPVQLPAVTVSAPAPAQGLFVDVTNSLIKLGVAAAAAAFASKLGVDAATAQSWAASATPILQSLAAVGVSALMGFSLFRSIQGANLNTAAKVGA